MWIICGIAKCLNFKVVIKYFEKKAKNNIKSRTNKDLDQPISVFSYIVVKFNHPVSIYSNVINYQK